MFECLAEQRNVGHFKKKNVQLESELPDAG